MSDDSLNKVPPQSLEAEMSLLGSLLIDKDAVLKIADIIIPEDFYKIAHSKIFETIMELYSRNEPVDLLTLNNRLTEKNLLENIGGKTYLVKLTDSVATASNVVNYAQIVRRKATRRRLLTAAQEISRLGFEEEGEIDSVLDEAQRHLFGVSQNYFKQSFTPIRGVLAEAFDRIDELHKNKGQLRGLASGFSELDRLLTGFQKSDLIILAARPSVGKTSLALDFVRHAGSKMKVPVGLFSLEMSKEQLVDRLLCAEANIDLWRLRSGRLSERPEDGDFSRIGHAIGSLSEAPIFIDDTPNINILQLRTKARRLQIEHGLGLIVVDYLQLMDSRRSSENRVQEVAEITRGLKGIARELNVPVIALSQLSRVVEQSKPAIPKLSHLRESGSIEQDADVVMFIYRKARDNNYRADEIPPDEKYIAELRIEKHRNGPTGMVKLVFNEASTSFRNLDSQIRPIASPNTPPAPQQLRPKSDFVKKPEATPTIPPM
jgi:replicative DNA helicase